MFFTVIVMVKNKTLLLIACLVWSAAGFNILRIGIIEYPPYLSAVNFLLSAVVFAVFQFFVFGRLVKKHTKRIDAYGEQKQLFIKFFDVKSFIINGCNDDRRYSFKVAAFSTRRVYRGVLHRTGSRIAARRNTFWQKFFV